MKIHFSSFWRDWIFIFHPLECVHCSQPGAMEPAKCRCQKFTGKWTEKQRCKSQKIGWPPRFSYVLGGYPVIPVCLMDMAHNFGCTVAIQWLGRSDLELLASIFPKWWAKGAKSFLTTSQVMSFVIFGWLGWRSLMIFLFQFKMLHGLDQWKFRGEPHWW